MANFSVNQVTQLYVAESLETTIGDITPEKGIKVSANDGKLYFTYKGADGPIRSDLIDISKITYSKAISSDELRRPLRSVKVSLSSELNGGNPIAGQIYVLGINILGFGSPSPEDTYYKNAAVNARTGMTPIQFYTALADALKLSFKRESIPMFTFEATASGVNITEIEQPWRRGIKASNPIMANILTSTVKDEDGFEIVWGTVTENTPSIYVENGKLTADFEYFCMGERGDIYRGIGFPNNIETTYFVDPTKAYNYIELQFHYTGTGNAVQESQKRLVIVSSTEATTNAIVGAINTAVGTTLIDPLA